MTDIKIVSDSINGFVSENDVLKYKQKAAKALNSLFDKTGSGNDYLGWVKLPSHTENELLNEIQISADYLRNHSNVLVVIGIGGSYLGARAIIEALSPSFDIEKTHRVVYAGHNISEEYHAELLNYLDGVEYSLAVISKSGTTTEPAIAFRLLRKHIESKYGKNEAKKRIIAITDKKKGALKKLSEIEGYKTFDIADDIGGRFSVLSPVGLFPIAFAGFSIHDLIKGSLQAENEFAITNNSESNPVLKYAIIRNLLYQQNLNIELLTSFNPKLFYLIEWWKQLYGESEGKDGKGIFTAGSVFSTDLHSLGQYIQDGQRILFETVISVEAVHKKLEVPPTEENIDGLNYLVGRRLHDINKTAQKATIQAHYDGKVPVIIIRIPELNEHILGQLIYFFELACGISGYLLDVNPFDQPGVETYKKNMFRLLGKPGH